MDLAFCDCNFDERNTMSLLEGRTYYKPFKYPWAYKYYKQSEQMHWLPEEVEFRDDIKDWNEKLTPEEKNLLTQLFRFFTQADIDVASGYNNVYLPNLGKHPEIAMMMNSFAAREAVHIDAYSTLIETLNMPETTYSAFAEYEAMEAKHDYMSKAMDAEHVYELLLSLAVFSAFGEGMQLFSSFAILMNFERHNKMKGMCNIVRWSIKDESLHVAGMTYLFKKLYEESKVRWQSLNEDVHNIKETMIMLEDKFIDLAFEQGGIEGLTADEVKEYIRFIAAKRMSDLGMGLAGVPENPLPWLDWVVNGKEHTNFFEARPTEYSKGTVQESEVEW
jgi:ribonucleoside-diphosphate reductase beta chain